MLFETLKQSFVFLGTIYFGILAGIVRDFCLFVFNLFKKNKIVKLILDILFMIIISILFILCLNVVNYGEFRLYLLLSYILGFVVERKTIGYLVDFIFQKIYNLIVKGIKKLSQTKIFKRILGNDTRKSKQINKDC